LNIDGAGVLSLPDGTVANAKFVSIPSYNFHARVSGGTGPVENVSAATVASMIGQQKVGCLVHMSADLSLANETWTKITFTTPVFNDGNGYNVPAQRWVPPFLGKQVLFASIYVKDGLLAGTPLTIAVYKNGTLHKQMSNGCVANYGSALIAFMDNCSSTDYYEVYANAMTAAAAVVSSTPAHTYFSAYQA
jgi:hypothetical protein